MKIENFHILASILLLTVVFATVFTIHNVWAQASSIQATVIITICGNEVVESGEDCDGSNLNGQTCQSQGFSSGTLTCRSDCSFNTSNCAPGGGGGSGPGYVPFFLRGKVILQGKAYPGAKITILKDGQIATTVPADPQANFKAEIPNLIAGTYTFGLWAEDAEERRSITVNFTINVAERTTTTISGIFLVPTISLEKTVLQKGEVLHISGRTAPGSEVHIFLESEIVKTIKAEDDGSWSYDLDTFVLDDGSYGIQIQAISADDLVSNFSQTLEFSIGEEITKAIQEVDINRDGKVNLVDFSILLFNWGVPKNPAADLNGDGEVNLIDFSIMMYYWTG